MKQTLLCVAFLLSCSFARAQTPDVIIPPILAQGNGTFGGPNGYYDNRAVEAVTWTVAYQSDGGITGFTLAFQSATGTNLPGTFATLTPVASSASFGTGQYGVATFNVLSATPGSSVAAPWVQVKISGGSGVGGIRIEVYGYRTGPTGGTGGGGGGGGGSGCPNPCPVEGVDAAGAAPTVPPVGIAGFDGTDVRRVKTDSSGDVNIQGGAAVGGSSLNPVTTGSLSDAGTVLADHTFPDEVAITLSAGTDVVIAPGNVGKITYIGSLSFSDDSSQDVTIRQGSGTTCLTLPLTIAGPYKNVVALALDFTNQGPLHSTVAGNDICLHFGGSVTSGGVVVYGQH